MQPESCYLWDEPLKAWQGSGRDWIRIIYKCTTTSYNKLKKMKITATQKLNQDTIKRITNETNQKIKEEISTISNRYFMLPSCQYKRKCKRNLDHLITNRYVLHLVPSSKPIVVFWLWPIRNYSIFRHLYTKTRLHIRFAGCHILKHENIYVFSHFKTRKNNSQNNIFYACGSDSVQTGVAYMFSWLGLSWLPLCIGSIVLS